MASRKTIQRVEYRPIPGHSRYLAGSDGSIWSMMTQGTSRKMRPSYASGGYGRVKLDGIKFGVGPIILLAFIGARPVGTECCHNDGDRRNNRLSNLRWDTHARNERDKIKHGTLLSGSAHSAAKLTENQISKLRRLRRQGWSCGKLARQFGISKSYVGGIARMTRKQLCSRALRYQHTPHECRVGYATGSRVASSKLTEAQVREIRRSSLPHTELARSFGVVKNHIYKIKARLIWRRT